MDIHCARITNSVNLNLSLSSTGLLTEGCSARGTHWLSATGIQHFSNQQKPQIGSNHTAVIVKEENQTRIHITARHSQYLNEEETREGC